MFVRTLIITVLSALAAPSLAEESVAVGTLAQDAVATKQKAKQKAKKVARNEPGPETKPKGAQMRKKRTRRRTRKKRRHA